MRSSFPRSLNMYYHSVGKGSIRTIQLHAGFVHARRFMRARAIIRVTHDKGIYITVRLPVKVTVSGTVTSGLSTVSSK